MFLYSENLRFIALTLFRHFFLVNKYFLSGKDVISPLSNSKKRNIRAFFFTPLRGTLTVEAAVVLPVFLFAMVAVLQYGAVMKTATELGTALAETGKKMAMTAYVTKYGGDTGKVTEFVAGALSAAYAQYEVTGKAGDISMIKNENMLLSSFLQEDEMIDLALTYQIRSPVGIISLPGTFFIQSAKVRAWTGRTPPESGDGASGEVEEDSGLVYVTASGTVYHEDADCTHLKLSVQSVFASQLDSRRNSSGGIYHACEKCGEGSSSVVYITKDGNRYHSTLTCSGLKRTVKQISKEDACDMKACARCGKG